MAKRMSRRYSKGRPFRVPGLASGWRRWLDPWILARSQAPEKKTMTADKKGAASVPLPRPSEGSHHLDPSALDWQPTDAPGFCAKPLLRDPVTGARTELSRMDPAAHVGVHSHDQLEAIPVLSGECSDT